MSISNSHLRKVRGELYPVTVNPDATVNDILPLAVDKHCACNWHLARSAEFVLLYPDGQLVDCLPGSEVPFTLSAYREFLGKSFQKLRLYICKKDSFAFD